MSERTTISETYLRQQRDLHLDPRYGVASLGFCETIKDLIPTWKVHSISDYGAGKCNLRQGLADLGVTGIDYHPYDPAFPEYGEPKPADLVACIDVLEHIEEEYLDNVLQDLRDITHRVGFISVHTGPASKVLPDGRNAHLIQQRSGWWLLRICQYFDLVELQSVRGGFWMVTRSKA